MAAVIARIDVKKMPSYYRKKQILLKGVELADQPEFADFQQQCYQFWDSNIYDVFNKRLSMELPVSYQLMHSLTVKSSDKNKISFSMRNLTHSGAHGEGGGRTSDYGKYLRNGTKSSQGLYNPALDRKMRHGTTSGVSPKYWKSWMKMFRPYVQEQAKDMVVRIWRRVGK